MNIYMKHIILRVIINRTFLFFVELLVEILSLKMQLYNNKLFKKLFRTDKKFLFRKDLV